MGDWSMNKTGIKSISTPNKKWENLEVYAEYPGVLLNTLRLKD